jgi:large subunit ribosomal protein L18
LSRETKESRDRRHKRLRKKVEGTPERPRLSVYRSLNNVYAQVIDDTKGNTIVGASTLDKELSDQKGHKGNMGMAKKVGELVARRALAKGLKKVVFDRGGYRYHGRVKALADGAREAGLEF